MGLEDLGARPLAKPHSKGRGRSIYRWEDLWRGQQAGRLGPQSWAMVVSHAHCSRGEIEESGRKGLEGAALQTWGHLRPPGRCNRTL